MIKSMSKSVVFFSAIAVIVLLVTVLIGAAYFVSSSDPSPSPSSSPTSTSTSTLAPTLAPTPTPIAATLYYTHEIVENSTAFVRFVGDVDGDGYNDIVAAFEYVGLYWYRYPNWDKHLIDLFNWDSNDISCADINNDGRLDVIGIQDSDGKLYWYENSGTDTWTRFYICLLYTSPSPRDRS